MVVGGNPPFVVKQLVLLIFIDTRLQVAGLEEELKEKAVVVAEKAPGFGGR